MGTFEDVAREMAARKKQEAEDRQTYPFGTPKRVLNERQEAERRKLEQEKKHTDFEKIRWPLPEEPTEQPAEYQEEVAPVKVVASDDLLEEVYPTVDALWKSYYESRGTAAQCAQVAVDLGLVNFRHEFMLRCVPPERRLELMEAWVKLDKVEVEVPAVPSEPSFDDLWAAYTSARERLGGLNMPNMRKLQEAIKGAMSGYDFADICSVPARHRAAVIAALNKLGA